jgi:dipeptidase E
MPNLLLLSNSTNSGSGYLEHALKVISEFLADVTELVFIPFALADHDGYTARAAGALEPLGVRVRGLHAEPDPVAAIAQASAVFTGGGNTFRLVKALQTAALMDPLRATVTSGKTRYLGSSAGTNIASPTLRTTNDMPIVQPLSFETLGLVPFQINPHFLDADPTSTHAGETREERIAEFLEENDVAVLGLREGTYLRVWDDHATIGGQAVQPSAPGPAVLFRRGQAPAEVAGDVSELLLPG